MTRVVLTQPFPRGVDAALAQVPGVDLVVAESREEAVPRLAGAPVLVTFEWDDAFLTPGLRWIQSVSAGVEQFPIERLRGLGVALTSARGVNAPAVAEHAFALLLSLVRAVGVSMRGVGERVWRPRMGDEIGGRTMGILGLGAVGEEVARRASAWGMRVVGTKRDPSTYAGVADEVLPPSEVVEVFGRSDVVVAALPDDASTRGVVDLRCFDALDGGWFVNVGRGSAVAEETLLEALESGSLLGAGLDVFPTEPLPTDSPLWSHPRVVITPHMAGLSPRYGPRLAEVLRANLAALGGAGEWVNRIV